MTLAISICGKIIRISESALVSIAWYNNHQVVTSNKSAFSKNLIAARSQ